MATDTPFLDTARSSRAGVYTCVDCGHEDNNVDPKDEEILGPIHSVRMIDGQIVDYCLICNRACRGEYRYEP